MNPMDDYRGFKISLTAAGVFCAKQGSTSLSAPSMAQLRKKVDKHSDAVFEPFEHVRVVGNRWDEKAAVKVSKIVAVVSHRGSVSFKDGDGYTWRQVHPATPDNIHISKKLAELHARRHKLEQQLKDEEQKLLDQLTERVAGDKQ